MPAKTSRARRSTPRPRTRTAALVATPPRTAWAELSALEGAQLSVRWNAKSVAAKTVVPLDAATIEAAIAARTPVLVTWTDAEPGTPVILGLLHPVAPERSLRLDKHPDHAKVDGRRVSLTAADEIELRCGQASITLRRNGRLVIRGAFVETSSSGTNRIKGGSVQIN